VPSSDVHLGCRCGTCAAAGMQLCISQTSQAVQARQLTSFAVCSMPCRCVNGHQQCKV
jgi:hypothetical protein